jgi:hypothetical protein
MGLLIGRRARTVAAELEVIAWIGSDGAHAAVDRQFAGGDEAAVVGSQEQHLGRDLFGPRHAAERDIAFSIDGVRRGASRPWRHQ